MKSLTNERKVFTFESLAISKKVHPSLITMVQHGINTTKCTKNIIWNRKKSKNKSIKHCQTAAKTVG